MARAVPPGRVTLSLPGSSTPRPDDLHVDWRTTAYSYTADGRSVSRADGFGPAALLAWMSDCGCRPVIRERGPAAAAAAAQVQAAGVVAAIDEMRFEASTTSITYLGPKQTGGIAEPTQVNIEASRLPPGLSGLAWLVVWIAGAIYLLVWRNEPR
jgi:hypothetical protein